MSIRWFKSDEGRVFKVRSNFDFIFKYDIMSHNDFQDGSAQFFYDTNSFNDDGGNTYKKRKGLGFDGDRKRQKQVFDQGRQKKLIEHLNDAF